MDVFTLAAKLTLNTDEYEKSLNDASKETNDWKSALGDAGKALAGVGTVVGGVVAAGYKMASQTAEQADEIDKMSQKVGLSSKAYQEWDYVLNLAGTSMSNMSTGLKTLTNKIDDAKNGSSSAQEMFQKLGISMDDLNNMSREEIFAATIEGFQGMADSTERAALANDLYGKSGQELTPLFNQTSDETAALIQQINDLGGIMSDDAVKAGAQFEDSLTTMKASFNGVTNQITSKLMPAFTKTMDKISEFIGSGGLEGLIDTINKAIPIVAGLTAGFVAYKSAVAIAAIVAALQKATESMTLAQAALNAVMNANPFVLVATLIAGLVTALIVLWNTNEDFRNAVINIWEKVKEVIGGVVESIAEFFTKTIPEKFNEMVDLLKSLPDKMLDLGKNIVDGIWNGIKDGWDKLVTNVKELAGQLIDGVKDKLGIHSPSKVFAAIGDMCVQGFENSMEALTDGSILDDVNTSLNALTIKPNVSASLNYAEAKNANENATINVVLQGDAERIFRLVQQESSRNVMLTGKPSFA